jgi:tetrapyrrole methylase family protein/MazG family protein
MPKAPKNTRDFTALVEVIEHLRGPDGCPWDKEQTHSTLTQYAIEEAHELATAIDSGNTADIVEELGDLLLQVILHAEIGRQAGLFTLADVIQGITEKMIHRHPHVFGDVKVDGSEQVLENWSKIKDAEKANKTETTPDSPFASIPETLPALIRA